MVIGVQYRHFAHPLQRGPLARHRRAQLELLLRISTPSCHQLTDNAYLCLLTFIFRPKTVIPLGVRDSLTCISNTVTNVGRRELVLQQDYLHERPTCTETN